VSGTTASRRPVRFGICGLFGALRPERKLRHIHMGSPASRRPVTPILRSAEPPADPRKGWTSHRAGDRPLGAAFRMPARHSGVTLEDCQFRPGETDRFESYRHAGRRRRLMTRLRPARPRLGDSGPPEPHRLNRMRRGRDDRRMVALTSFRSNHYPAAGGAISRPASE
jgi:hypothetical protein